MNQAQSYKAKTPLSASPATNANSTITRTSGQKAWLISVSVQDAYISFDDTTDLSTTVGLTVPAGTILFVPAMGNISCKAVTTGAIVNAIPLE